MQNNTICWWSRRTHPILHVPTPSVG